jgi:two-component system CheB/CheR fusion protein
VLNGPDAIDAAPEFEPDVVLLDLGLPVMDGFEVAERLRTLPALGPIEIVAITGYGLDVHRERTLRSGFDEHMVKPVDIDVLGDWLRQSWRRRTAPARPARPGKRPIA